MEKIIGFFKEDWKFKLAMMIVAIAIGVGSYFNYKVDNASLVLELAMVIISSIVVIGFATVVYYRLVKKKAFDTITFGTAVVLSMVFDVLAHLIF